MQYVIARATTAEIQGDEQDIVYLVSSTETVLEHQLSWCFTDGHAVEELSTFFDRIEALGQLDWDTIRAREWYNTDADPDRKRRKQAEFLVYRFVPWTCVREIVVSKSSLARRVNQLLKNAINRPWISTRPQWFYNKG